MRGGTSFTFVTDGIESALEQARGPPAHGRAARRRRQRVQRLSAGLVDERRIHLVPVPRRWRAALRGPRSRARAAEGDRLPVGHASAVPRPQPGRRRVMGKVVVTEFVSLDGVMEDPGGARATSTPVGRSSRPGCPGRQVQVRRAPRSRRAAARPRDLRGVRQGLAVDRRRSRVRRQDEHMPKYVVSNILRSADWNNSTVLDGDPSTEVSGLKQRAAGDILVAGSSQLVQGLLDTTSSTSCG